MSEPNKPSIRAYIENAHNSSIGGFTIPLPATKETLQPWLQAIEVDDFQETDIAIREVRSSIPKLESVLQNMIAEGVAFDELNYLGMKLGTLNKWCIELFGAALETDRYSGSIQELIDLTENTACFELLPAFNEERYGEFLIETARDNTAEVFERLQQSDNSEERELARHILQLEASVETRVYGRNVVQEEKGIFTKMGYLAERGAFQKNYRGVEDIPLDYRIFSAPPPPLITMGVDMPTFLVGLHATAGDYSRDTAHSLNILNGLRSAEYLLLLDGSGAFLTEAMHTYRRGTTAYDLWMNTAEKQGVQAFSIHLTEVHGRIEGNVAQVDIAARQLDLLHHSIQHMRVDAVFKSGDTQSFAPSEWEEMSAIDRDKIESWVRHFDSDDLRAVSVHLDDLLERIEAGHRQVSPTDFLSEINASYMAQAQNPQPDMLRVSQMAAKELLARGDCAVCRLLPEAPQLLTPTDAIKSGLWFSEHRVFAIWREDAAGLQKWAERSAASIINRPHERGEQKKSQEPEV